MSKKTHPCPIIDRHEDLFDKDQILPYKPPAKALPAYKDLDGMLDLEHCIEFLHGYRRTKATFSSYRREVERLLQWSWHIHGSSILQLTKKDLDLYMSFVLEPPVAWIGTKTVARFKTSQGQRVPNSQWRPFVVTVPKIASKSAKPGKEPEADVFAYKPSKASIEATLGIISALYEYLLQEQLVDRNYVKSLSKSDYVATDSEDSAVYRLSPKQWKYVLETTELEANKEKVKNNESNHGDRPLVYERMLFVVSALYIMYLRVSELAANERSIPMMSDFREEKKGVWWFYVRGGKGNKNRKIAVRPEMLKALKRFRKSRGLTPLPTLGEQDMPLLIRLRRNETDKGKSKDVNNIGAIASTRQVRLIAEESFDLARARMLESKEDLRDIESLKAASAHWLRHTGISDDVQNRQREHVRDDAGHSTLAITDRYINSDDNERHESAQKKRKRPSTIAT